MPEANWIRIAVPGKVDPIYMSNFPWNGVELSGYLQNIAGSFGVDNVIGSQRNAGYQVEPTLTTFTTPGGVEVTRVAAADNANTCPDDVFVWTKQGATFQFNAVVCAYPVGGGLPLYDVAVPSFPEATAAALIDAWQPIFP